MVIEKPYVKRYPKVPFERRVWAFLLDFVLVWLVSIIGSGNALLQGLVFLAVWLGLRVLVVSKNQGQSLGRFAFDVKVYDARFSRVPGLLPLAKREAIAGVAALLAMVGLNQFPRNPLSMLLLISPLVIDAGIAFADDSDRTFHDRIADTTIVPTRRGISLDLRLKQAWQEVKFYLRKRQ